jgi:hypothetical protein
MHKGRQHARKCTRAGKENTKEGKISKKGRQAKTYISAGKKKYKGTQENCQPGLGYCCV